MLALYLAALFMALNAVAEERFPADSWKDRPNPLASPMAEPGGSIRIFGSQYPKSFNYYLDNNSFSSDLFGLQFATLLTVHPIHLGYEPGLARSVTVSNDKKTFTFSIDPKAAWSDGKPLTAHDVKWTVDMIKDPKILTGPHKVPFERIDSPVVIDDLTIRFTAQEVHWRNLLSLGSFQILPRHDFEGKDFNKANFEFPVVSGRYRISDIKEGFHVRLERRDDYWDRDSERSRGVGNFQTMEFKFYPERDIAYEAFKKGDIDLFAVYTAHRWVQQTTGETFDRNWILKQRVFNSVPIGFQGFAMNLRRPLFQDKRVRLALAHLLDRERMNRTLMHNQYTLHRSYFEDLYDDAHPNPSEGIPFDKDKARELLAEAGWSANPETGFLEKDGEVLKVNFLTRSAASDKFLVIYKEDLKDVGIDLGIERKDWAAWINDMEEYNYDMTWASWGASLWKDPEGMWHSKEASRPSGNNITGYRNPKVDELIEKQRDMFDVAERNRILQEIDRILCEDIPYVLLWNSNNTRLLYWNRFGTPGTVLSKYGREASAYAYWWVDPDAEADLESARDNGESLAPVEADIYFDRVYSP
jgi:microcin C transport system substrate-binding protein